MICQICQADIAFAFSQLCERVSDDLPDGDFSSGAVGTLGHGREWLSFCNSVSLGCHICSILCSNLTSKWSGKERQAELDPATELDAVQYRFQHFHHGNKFIFTTDDGMSMTSSIKSSMSATTVPRQLDLKECAEKFSIVPFMDKVDDLKGDLSPKSFSNTGDAGAWQAAKSWMEECLLEHDECKIPADADWTYPRRLLDLGSEDQSLIRLIDTMSEQVAGAYVTLSHSWGGESPFKLVKANLSYMMEGVAVYSLPLTFKEAVDISRRLGVRYLWVDALCVTQDDIKDRHEQIATIGSVYSNSLCTISAMASKDPSEGLFRKRRNIHAGPAAVVIDQPDTYAGKYAVYSISDLERYRGEHLTSRAWAFQERVMSNRILAFGSNGLYWECKTCAVSYRSESCPQGVASTSCEKFQLSSLDACMGFDAIKMIPDPAENPRRSVRAWWKRSVKDYSSCQLTRPEDRLAAFSAIPRRFGGSLGSEYLAGLWKEWLPYDMCWVPSKPGRHPKKYVAPSWSWASVSEELSPDSWNEPVRDSRDPEDYCKPMIEMLEYEIVPVGNDSMGLLVSAWMCISGFILPISGVFAHKLQEDPERCDFHSHCEDISIHWDYLNGRSSIRHRMFLLPLIEYLGDPDGKHWTKGIILEADPGNADGFFRRIGVFAAVVEADSWLEFCLWCLKHDKELQKLYKASPEKAPTGEMTEERRRWDKLVREVRQQQAVVLV